MPVRRAEAAGYSDDNGKMENWAGKGSRSLLWLDGWIEWRRGAGSGSGSASAATPPASSGVHCCQPSASWPNKPSGAAVRGRAWLLLAGAAVPHAPVCAGQHIVACCGAPTAASHAVRAVVTAAASHVLVNQLAQLLGLGASHHGHLGRR